MRFLSFLRSMKFAITLLVLVMAFSLAGSLIPQDRAAEWYIGNYPTAGTFILKLGVDNLFQSWYFISILGLLCISILFCSIARFGAIHKNALRAAASSRDGKPIDRDTAENLRKYLSDKRYRKQGNEETTVFYKNLSGYYGSFVVHLSFLLILVFGGLVLGLSDAADYDVMPGETLFLEDGTGLTLEDFRITDETGKLDYVSTIEITAPDDTQSGQREISVNYPFVFRSRKYYQHSYGRAGSVTAVNTKTGGSDKLYLTEESFLSEDGQNGILFEYLSPDLSYQVRAVVDGKVFPTTMRPGNKIQTGDIVFEFNEPVYYPGIRVKRIANPFPVLLYGSFVLLTIGFWLCFFHTPVIVTVCSESYAITGSKISWAQFEIESFLKKEKL